MVHDRLMGDEGVPLDVGAVVSTPKLACVDHDAHQFPAASLERTRHVQRLLVRAVVAVQLVCAPTDV